MPQLKVDVGMLNTVKIYGADVSSVSLSSEQKSFGQFTCLAVLIQTQAFLQHLELKLPLHSITHAKTK